MTSRVTVAVLATLAACGLAQGQTAAPHAPGTGPTAPVAPAPVVFVPVAAGPAACCGAPVFTNCCDHAACGPDGRAWVSGEFLFGWLRAASLPPLITVSPPG